MIPVPRQLSAFFKLDIVMCRYSGFQLATYPGLTVSLLFRYSAFAVMVSTEAEAISLWNKPANNNPLTPGRCGLDDVHAYV